MPTITDYQILASVYVDEPIKVPSDNIMNGMDFIRINKGGNNSSITSVNPHHMTVPSLDYVNCFDSLIKRMSTNNEESQLGLNLISFNSNKPNSSLNNNIDTNCYSQSVCNEGGIIDPRIVDSSINFQELNNELPFNNTGRFMQWRSD